MKRQVAEEKGLPSQVCENLSFKLNLRSNQPQVMKAPPPPPPNPNFQHKGGGVGGGGNKPMGRD